MAIYEFQEVYLEHFPTKEDVINFISKIPSLERYWIILHGKDVKANGEVKKPHWHVYAEYSSSSHHFKTDVIRDYASKSTFKTLVAVRNVRSALRYLTHKDNKEKFQYSDTEVISNDMDFYTEAITQQIKESKFEVINNEIKDALKSIYPDGNVPTKELKRLIFTIYDKYEQSSWLMVHYNNVIRYFNEYIELFM